MIINYNNKIFEFTPDCTTERFLVGFITNQLSPYYHKQLSNANSLSFQDYFLHEKICLLGYHKLNAEIKFFRLKNIKILEGVCRKYHRNNEKIDRVRKKVVIMSELEKIGYYERNKNRNYFKKV